MGFFNFLRNCMDFAHMFRLLTHFELIFVYGVRWGSSFILLHVEIQFSWQHCLRGYSFPHCLNLVNSPLDCRCVGLFQGFRSALSVCFRCYGFMISFKIGKLFSSIALFQDCFDSSLFLIWHQLRILHI